MDKVNQLSDTELEALRDLVQRELYLRSMDTYNQSIIEVLKAVFEFAYITIKSLILANGGAIIALLTLTGTIWKKDEAKALANIFPSLWWFCGGLALALMVSLSSYITQYCYAYEEQEKGKIFHSVAVISGCLSLEFFVIGSINILCSFY